MVFDTHLMISDPEKYIKQFADAGSDWITFHIETVKNPSAVIRKIKGLGKKAGISINPKTPVSKIKRYLGDIDLVLVMSVNPGFGGQKFMPEVMSKVRDLKKEKNKFKISVDGGINFDTIVDVSRAGADIAVAGYSVFCAGNDIVKNIRKLKQMSDIRKED
jgi:ribulose-phosphate 3-epimerase